MKVLLTVAEVEVADPVVELTEGSALEVRGRSGVEVSGQLPDSDGGLGNAGAGAVVQESDLRAAACDDITGGLEAE